MDISVKELKEALKNAKPNDIGILNDCRPIIEHLEMDTLLKNAIKNNMGITITCKDGAVYRIAVTPHTETEWRIRNVAADICNVFEDLLEEFGLTIPSKLREGEPDEARLFGDEYQKVEDAVLKILVSTISTAKNSPNTVINTMEY